MAVVLQRSQRLRPSPLSRLRRLAPALLTAAPVGCTTFATVRSAEVRPGAQAGVESSVTGAVGAVAGWFWSDECASACDRSVPGIDINAAYGWRPRKGVPFTLGAGSAGLVYPYVEGYAELGRLGPVPVGVGGRLGIPGIGWAEHSVFARADLPVTRSVRLLYNPGWMLHTGHSPNSQNRGTFRGFVNGAGVEADFGPLSVVPSIGYVAGRAEYSGAAGTHYGPERHGFGWFAVAINAHRSRTR
jgi:hypothetical protein